MTRSSDLAIVLNPEAGGGGRYDDLRLEGLRTLAHQRAVVFSTGDRELVEAVAEGVRERGAETVAVIGGDGTVSFVLSALHRAFGDAPLPKIALLRGGTMNTIANSFGVPRRQPEELLRRLLASQSSATIRRATLKVQGRIGFLFSTGVMVGFLKVLYRTTEAKPGPLGALKLLGKGSWQAITGTGGNLLEQIDTPLLATLRIDGNAEPPRRYTVFGAATVAEVGLGFRPFLRAEECLERFQVFAFHGSLQSLVRQLPRIRRGQPIAKGLGFDPIASELAIETPGEPIAYALDGDVREAENKLVVGLGPQVEIRTYW